MEERQIMLDAHCGRLFEQPTSSLPTSRILAILFRQPGGANVARTKCRIVFQKGLKTTVDIVDRDMTTHESQTQVIQNVSQFLYRQTTQRPTSFYTLITNRSNLLQRTDEIPLRHLAHCVKLQ